MYRHEWKWAVGARELAILRQRLRAVMTPDSHGDQGSYRVRSLYFDTPDDRALREKLAGLSRREKFRIRLYDGSTDLIHLEKKVKNGGLGYKLTAKVTAGQVAGILDGDISWMMDSESPLVRELYCTMQPELLRPQVIVDYHREAFTYAPGNVRVTFDTDVRAGPNVSDFLLPNPLTVPIPNKPAILEVKWDAFLPDPIRAAVHLDGVRAAPFSKYAACRFCG